MSQTKSERLIETSGDATKKLSGLIPAKLFLEFKSGAAARDTTMTDLLITLMAKWIDEEEEKLKKGK